MNNTMTGCHAGKRCLWSSLRGVCGSRMAVWIVFFAMAGWTSAPLWPEKPRASRPVKMERFYAVATEDDLVSHPGGMDMAGDTVFISHNFQHRMHVFFLDRTNHVLKPVRQFSQKGQGPGDLNLPMGVSVGGDLVAVKHEGGFSIFTREGVFRKKFRYSHVLSSFQFRDNVFYCCAPNPNGPWLAEALNDEGKSLVTFGKKPFPSLNYENKDRTSPAHIEDFFNGCAMVAGDGWIGLFHMVTGGFYQFGRDGKPVREKELAKVFGVEGERRIKVMKEQAASGLKPRDPKVRSIYKVLYRVFYVPGKFILHTPFDVTKNSIESDDRSVNKDDGRWCLVVLNEKTLEPEDYLVLAPGSGEWRWFDALVQARENGAWLYLLGDDDERFGLAEFRLF